MKKNSISPPLFTTATTKTEFVEKIFPKLLELPNAAAKPSDVAKSPAAVVVLADDDVEAVVVADVILNEFKISANGLLAAIADDDDVSNENRSAFVVDDFSPPPPPPSINKSIISNFSSSSIAFLTVVCSSAAAKCCSIASNKLLGALVKSGISPRSIPAISATLRNSATLFIRQANKRIRSLNNKKNAALITLFVKSLALQSNSNNVSICVCNTVTNALNTTIQLDCCVRSINKFANCGIDTFGSSVHCNKSFIKSFISAIISSVVALQTTRAKP
ncbi:hypothetical protein DERP_005967 [Dermatophagoides pteronyssinus]|uniref:Uncharacterized protein n=1 Tax=Dermatophagoides pteronyssinus TaxID=6956 RepID=A0ABQ8JRY5_DERPT|nr:hypothetical protein DERP_005967 [Dermatophagoides pteronyssinus]